MTARGLEQIRHVVHVGDRVAVAVTRDMRVVVAVPDGQAEVDVEELTAALAECEAYAEAFSRVGLRSVLAGTATMAAGRVIGAAR